MPETTAHSAKVFLSHTKADKEFVRRLAKDLKEYGFPVWLDEWELRVGDSLVGEIEKGIDTSAWMIIVLSPAALKSEWVLKELRAGLVRETERGKVFVLPALYAKVELPPFLRDKFYADFTDSYEDGLRLIRDRLVGSYGEKAEDDLWLLVRREIRTIRRLSEAPTSLYLVDDSKDLEIKAGSPSMVSVLDLGTKRPPTSANPL
jgi:hypothetical protein